MAKPIKHRGKWRVRWVDEHGQRRSEVYDKYADALRAERMHQVHVAEVEQGRRPATPVDHTVGDLCDRWLENRAPQKRSQKDDVSIIKCHLRPALGHVKLRELGVDVVDRFALAKTSLDPKTVNNILTLLISMMRYAADIEWIHRVPRIRKPRIRLFGTDYRYLRSADEIRRLLLEAEKEGEVVAALYATAIFSGLRQGELAALRWHHVDLEKRIDAQTCKVIVLDQTIKSMTEFKQIIGRGTRINEDFGKLYFTILDFKKATELFADPAFDGDPVVVYTPKPGDPPAPPDDLLAGGSGPEDGDPVTNGLDGDEVVDQGADGGANPGDGSMPGWDGSSPGSKRVKYVVGDVPVHVIAERVQYYGKDGKLVTESLREYARKAVLEEYDTLTTFLHKWSEADRKQAIMKALEENGVFFEELAREVGKDFSSFDLVCHVAYDQPPLTRRERVLNVRKKNYFAKYGEAARAVLEALLDKYADEGVDDIENIQVLKVKPLDKFGTPMEIVEQRFGGKDAYLKAVRELEDELYTNAS